MLCRDIIKIIEKKYPASYALEWDNVGLLVGGYQKEVQRIYIALDATAGIVGDAVRQKTDLLITHHPLLFSPVRRITQEDLAGSKIIELIRNDISCYAMHTNYDVAGMAELSGKLLELQGAEVLEITCEEEEPKGIGKIGDLPEKMSLSDLCMRVKDVFHLDYVRMYGDGNTVVKRAAVSPGSGKSMIQPALKKHADVLITGDIGHHEGIDAADMGLCMIDAGHYGLEQIFAEDLRRYLTHALPEVTVLTAPAHHPFQTI